MTIQETKRTKKLNKQIEINIKRRTVIVDDKLVLHKGVVVNQGDPADMVEYYPREIVQLETADLESFTKSMGKVLR